MFTHLDDKGLPRMVNVQEKKITPRRATAQTEIILPKVFRSIQEGDDFISPKGSMIQTAIIAGTQAVKKTAELIPFCHQLPIESCDFKFEIDGLTVKISCEVKTTAKTGVEMEALTGVSVAALAFYDMGKALSSEIIMGETKLILKTGGKKPFILGKRVKGLVLTGGKSSRMGEDKALLMYQEKPQAAFLFDLLRPFCDEVYLSSREGQWNKSSLEKYPQLFDSTNDYHGPLNGIISALRSDPAALWLIVACDVVNFKQEEIHQLFHHYEMGDFGVFYQSIAGDFPEALAGLYDGKILESFLSPEMKNIQCPVKLLKKLPVKVLPQLHSHKILNLNTPQERKEYFYEQDHR